MMLFFIVLFSIKVPFPIDTKGPTVLFLSTAPSPIKQGSIIVALSKVAVFETKAAPSSCKNPNIRRLVCTVISLLPQSIHCETVPGLKTFPLSIILFIPSLIWYSPPLIMLLSSTNWSSFLSIPTSLK